MKVKIVEPKEWTTKTGKKKVLFKDGSGNMLDSWDLGLLKMVNQEIEGNLSSREYNGKTYTTFTPSEEKKIKEEIPEPIKTQEPSKVPSEVWEAKDKRMVRMHTQKVAGEIVSDWLQADMWTKETKTAEEIVKRIKAIAHELEDDVYRKEME